MKALFQYSLLQFRYAQSLGEVLNVGVLVLFPAQKKVSFLFPKNLARLRYTYRSAPEKTLRTYFKSFSKRVEQLNKQPELFADYEQNPDSFIDREFLTSDSSALQFGPIKTSLLYTENLSLIDDTLYEQFLSVYDPPEERARVDDADIKADYKTRVKNILHKIDRPRKLFTEDYKIAVPTPSYSGESRIGIHRFDFGWQNHGLHLVKPVSFDLLRGSAIQDKAHANLGQFMLLDDYAKDHNVEFDLLVAPPRDKSLLDNYEYAISILQQPKSVKLIESSKMEEYVEQTIQGLLEE